jgi:Protein of unknown function (DUF1559)
MWLLTRGLFAVGCGALVVTLLLGTVSRLREEARSSNCVCNLAQLECALSIYESTYGSLPPAVITGANGKPLLSWRVAILPIIGEESLYKQIKLDEPWDGPNNRRLNTVRPPIFGCPSHSDGAGKGYTDYLAVVGPRTLFPGGGKARKRSDIRDDPTSTLMLVESTNSSINWMEPRDLELDRMSFRLNDPSRSSISSDHHSGSYPGPHVLAAGRRAYPDNQVVASLGGSMTPETVKSLLIIDYGRKVVLRRGPWLD